MPLIIPKDAHTRSLVTSTKQGSRKSKKSWRRNIDTYESDLVLEKRAEAQRIGHSDVTTLLDADLFHEDKKGDFAKTSQAVRTSGRKHSSSSNVTSILDAVDGRKGPKPLIIKKRRKTKLLSGKSKRCLSKPELEFVKKQVKFLFKQEKETLEQDNSIYDPWDQENNSGTFKNLKISRPLEPEVKIHPGTSYNPSSEDKEKLEHTVKAISEVVKRAENDSNELNSYQSYSHPTYKSVFEDAVENISQNLSVPETEQQVELLPAPAKEMPGRLTRRERNRIKKLKLAQKALQEQNLDEIRNNDFSNVNSIIQDIEEKAEKQKKNRKIRQLVRGILKNSHRALGRARQLVAPSELEYAELRKIEPSSCLRAVKPVGNLLQEKFTSLQRRRMIEARGKLKELRKYPLVEYEPRYSKEFE